MFISQDSETKGKHCPTQHEYETIGSLKGREREREKQVCIKLSPAQLWDRVEALMCACTEDHLFLWVGIVLLAVRTSAISYHIKL